MGGTARDDPGERSDSVLAEAASVVITPIQDGPLHVKGSLEIVSGGGAVLQRVTEAWLCRCGGSANKPYCDGTHKRTGFKAEGRAPVRK